jgi:L-2-hydroxyglutarate oxidase LhgO
VASRFDESSLDKSKFAGAQDFVVVNAGHKALEVAQRLQADASSAARIVIGRCAW